MNGKTAVINKLLGLAGLELRQRGRTISDLMAQPRRASAGWVIEYIGTQGVGKTTLNNAVQKCLRTDWFFRSDLGQNGPFAQPSAALEDLHREIYFQKIKRFQKENHNAWKSITVTRQMSRVISESLTILTHDFPRGFILDESLFKNFPREVLKLCGDTPEPLWTKRAFIHLRTRDPDFVVSRYQSRVEERTRRGMPQIPPTEAEVRTRVQEDNVFFDTITEKAQAFGCPVIVIYAEDTQQDNIRKIIDLEKTIRAQA
ncbi:hypothetical protein [uncultured Roseobacter sp.]|uniref:hypothetical protein n=1 Tax=uncultured Roseobacter sp. TaxID=114847 RepID=UPI00262836B0|nr:hypothetical protein [uncultured Roseobacter sp.]